MGLCFDFPSCILSKIKKGFNASAKFPAVKEKSAAFTGSCLGGKLPRPSRAYPTVGRGPSCARAFRLRLFCHFPVRSRLRDMGPAQPNKALSHPQKPGARAAEGPFFSGSAGGKLPRPSRAHPAAGQGPSCARAFRLQPFLSFPGPQPPARHGAGAAKQGAFPSPKTRSAGR